MQVAYGDEITADASNTHMNCFGCCCDFRKAVITVNGIMLGFQIVSIYIIAIAAMEYEDFLLFAGVFVGVVGVIFSSLGIFGALKFSRCAIIATSVYYSIAVLGYLFILISGAAAEIIVNIIICALLLYPHVCFLILMDKGIMTEENYHRIKMCC